MILFVNVFVTNKAITIYDRGLLGPTKDRVDVFKYSLASLAVMKWSRAFIYYELDDDYQNREAEVDEFIYSLFADPLIYHYRNDHQAKWQKAVNQVLEIGEEDELVWFTANDDHIFIDYELELVERLKKKINNLAKQHKYVSCYFSHWPELLGSIRKTLKLGYERTIIEDTEDGFVILWRNCDSIQIVNKALLHFWWFGNEYGDSRMIRTDCPGGSSKSVISPETASLIPYREIVRHYDAYSHIGIDINACPPLFIPNGFFENKIKILYCSENRKEGYVHLNPILKNYSTVDKNGADLKCLLEDIPLFWKNRISEIDTVQNINRQTLLKHRNRAILNLACLDKRTNLLPYQIVQKIRIALKTEGNWLQANMNIMLDSIFCWDLKKHIRGLANRLFEKYPWLYGPIKKCYSSLKKPLRIV